jgi:hypothetical protein
LENRNRNRTQPVKTATGGPVFCGQVRPGCGFFPVAATGPSNTMC